MPGRPRECSNPAQKVKQLFRRDVFYTPVLGYRRVPGVTGHRADDKETDVGQTIAPLFYQKKKNLLISMKIFTFHIFSLIKKKITPIDYS